MWVRKLRAEFVAAMFLVLAVPLPAQKLSFLHPLDAGSPSLGTLGIATDSSGIYMVNLSGSRFVLHKLDAGGRELWKSESDEAHWLTATVTVAGGGIYVAGLLDGVAPGQTAAGGFDAYLVSYDAAGNQLW